MLLSARLNRMRNGLCSWDETTTLAYDLDRIVQQQRSLLQETRKYLVSVERPDLVARLDRYDKEAQ